MDKLRALRYFVAAAEEGSFGSAARRMQVSVPAVQKLVAALETSLGLRLFERAPQGLSLTTSGRDYLEACEPLLRELDAVDEALVRSMQRVSGHLVVGVHGQIAHHVLGPTLQEFHARYPDVQIDVRVILRLTDADAAGCDVFLLMGWPDASDLVCKRQVTTCTRVLAAPSYWHEHGLPGHPNDLAGHACLLTRNPAGTLIDLWQFEHGSEKASVKVGGWLVSSGFDVLLNAAVAGHGVGRFSEETARAAIRSGHLVACLLDWEMLGPPINLLFRPSQRRNPRVRAFLDFADALLAGWSDSRHGPRAASAMPPSWHRRGVSKASLAR